MYRPASKTKSRRNFPEVTLDVLHPGQEHIWLGLNNGDVNNAHNLRVVLRCGRRFGKTKLLETLGSIVSSNKGRVGWFCPNYKLLTPSYKELRKILHPITAHASRMDQIIELTTGGVIEFWTMSDEHAGRSRWYDWVIVDEVSLVEKEMQERWDKAIAPTLIDKAGNAIMAGTPLGVNPENYFYTACTVKDYPPGVNGTIWQEYHMPTWKNPTLPKDIEQTLRDTKPPLVFEQENMAEFVDWSGQGVFSRDNLLVDGMPVPDDEVGILDVVFATVDTAVKDKKEHDGTAVVYWGLRKFEPKKLYILGWDIRQIEGALLIDWLPGVYKNLELYMEKHKVRMGSAGTFIEDKQSGSILIQQARRASMRVHALSGDLTALGKTSRSINVSGEVYQGLVKITRSAYDHVVNYRGNKRNHLITQVTGFRIGQDDEEDDLLDAFTYGIAIGLGDKQGMKASSTRV